MRFFYSPHFKKRYKKLPQKIRALVDERLTLFACDPFDHLLNNHALRGEKRGYRSINITGDWRAVYRALDENTAYLVEIGTHSELYSE